MKRVESQSKLSRWDSVSASMLAWWYRLRARQLAFLARRPHRSFQPTRRRDYVRSLHLPGYWSFTAEVYRVLWRRKTVYGYVVLVYGVLVAIFVGLASQDLYTTLSETLKETSGEVFSGDVGQVGQAGLLLLAGMTGSLTETLSEVQQLYAVIFGLMAWLTTVWLLRAQLAGQRPRFRDALYSSGSPIVPTLLVAAVMMVQLLPIAIVALATSAALGSGFLESGAVAMVFTVAGVLLVTLSLYWITSTAIALVVVTLPGMYPMRAIRTAGDLVVGRRLRILYRWIWMVLMIVLIWMIVVIPFILLDTGLKSLLPFLSAVPIVPVVLLIVSSFTIVFSSAYIYLLYRKVVDDDASPA